MDDPEIIGSHTKRQLLAKMDGIIELAATKGNATVACTLYEVQNRYRDMPEIIRCKDCKYNNPFGCMKLQIIVGDDWFCADGERRTDDA